MTKEYNNNQINLDENCNRTISKTNLFDRGTHGSVEIARLFARKMLHVLILFVFVYILI